MNKPLKKIGRALFLGFLWGGTVAPAAFAAENGFGLHYGGKFVIHLHKVDPQRGNVSILLFRDSEGFPGNKNKAYSQFDIFPQTSADGTLLIDLSDIEADDYALFIYQDTNHNRLFDLSEDGRPLEPFVNGQNLRTLDYDQAVVIYDGMALDLNLSLEAAGAGTASPFEITQKAPDKDKVASPPKISGDSQAQGLFIEEYLTDDPQTTASAQNFLNDIYRYVNRSHLLEWSSHISADNE